MDVLSVPGLSVAGTFRCLKVPGGGVNSHVTFSFCSVLCQWCVVHRLVLVLNDVTCFLGLLCLLLLVCVVSAVSQQ